MQRIESKRRVLAAMATAAFALLASCASVPPTKIAADQLTADWLAEANP